MSCRWNRTAINVLLAAGIVALLLPGLTPASARISVYPSPGTPVASEATTFSFRGVKPNRLGPVRITGSITGRHAIEKRIRHSDGNGVSVVPAGRFADGEKVRVFTHRKIRQARHGTFSVRIGRFTGGSKKTSKAPGRVTNGLRSRPDLKLPKIRVAHTSPQVAPGSYFLGFRKGGLAILDNRGRITWYRPTAFGFSNFEPQNLNGRPVLTYFRTPTPGRDAAYIILNRHYRKIATVRPGNGYKADMHEFRLTDRGTALILAYRSVRRDLSGIGGPANGSVSDNVVQEIDLKTGAVLFEWHALGNVNLGGNRESKPKPGISWDAFHLNSIEPDGNSLLISSRWTNSIFRVDRASGRIKWTLRGDGRRSDFRVGRCCRFSGQHDVRRLPDGNISIFDNAGAPGRRAASVLVLKPGRSGNGKRKVSLVGRYRNPQGRPSLATGGGEVLPGGNVLAGWGNSNSLTEFSPSGEVLFQARHRSSSYRARKAIWNGSPPGRPAIASLARTGGITVYASWNGAQDIARWEVLGGPDASQLEVLGSSKWKSLETAIPISGTGSRLQVVALDADGRELGRSALIEAGHRSR